MCVIRPIGPLPAGPTTLPAAIEILCICGCNLSRNGSLTYALTSFMKLPCRNR